MNGKQKAFLWCGTIVVCLMIAFPPWLHIYTSRGETEFEDYGYSFIGIPATIYEYSESDRRSSVKTANAINLRKLGLQISIAALITVTGLLTGKETKKSKPEN